MRTSQYWRYLLIQKGVSVGRNTLFSNEPFPMTRPHTLTTLACCLALMLSCKGPAPSDSQVPPTRVPESPPQTAVSTDTTAKPLVTPPAPLADTMALDTSYSRTADGSILLTWHHLKQVEWTERFNDEVNAYIAYPDFHPNVLYLDGKKVQISGYVIPTEETNDETLIVLSAFPYSNCFFCGGAGPESVMDIKLARQGGTWEMDERVTFKGKLRLNDSDLYYLNYILEDAELVD